MPVSETAPAAFRRLCVETQTRAQADAFIAAQPPSGGCVLKQDIGLISTIGESQPPSGGCVLKHRRHIRVVLDCDTSRLQAAVC